MMCAGGSDLQLVKLVLTLHYLIFFLQTLHGNAEIMEEFISKLYIAIDRIVFILYKKSTTFWDNPRV